MPALVEQGMSCLVANKNATKKNINIINVLFNKYWKNLLG